MTTASGKKVITLYLDPDLHRAIKVRAAEGGVRITDLIIEAVKDSLLEENPYVLHGEELERAIKARKGE